VKVTSFAHMNGTWRYLNASNGFVNF